MSKKKDRAILPIDAPDIICRMASDGATKLQIGAALGVSQRTFDRLLDEEPDLQLALEQGRAIDEQRLSDILMGIAAGRRTGNAGAAMFLLKVRHRWREYAAIDDRTRLPAVVVMLPGAMPPDDYRALVDQRALPVHKQEVTDGHHSTLALSAERPRRPGAVRLVPRRRAGRG